jgi:hypothetical protein
MTFADRPVCSNVRNHPAIYRIARGIAKIAPDRSRFAGIPDRETFNNAKKISMIIRDLVLHQPGSL